MRAITLSISIGPASLTRAIAIYIHKAGLLHAGYCYLYSIRPARARPFYFGCPYFMGQ